MEEIYFLKSFKITFVSLIVEGFSFNIDLMGVSVELKGDWKASLA